jgi:tRNA(fMet)-specific endonuclease VapC
VSHLLDTNAVIALLKGLTAVRARLRLLPPDAVAISSIVSHELFFGAHRSQRKAQNLEQVEALRFPVLAFDQEDARQAGELRAALAAAGTPIGPYEVLIAGQALARGLTLVTHNVREFRRIPSLAQEDWEA